MNSSPHEQSEVCMEPNAPVMIKSLKPLAYSIHVSSGEQIKDVSTVWFPIVSSHL